MCIYIYVSYTNIYMFVCMHSYTWGGIAGGVGRGVASQSRRGGTRPAPGPGEVAWLKRLVIVIIRIRKL